MLFKRKKKKSLLSKAREVIWPKSGWKRAFLYIKHRILRLKADDRSIAMGLSIGCIISWTPTMPFQILQCFILCLILRANFFAAVTGTVIGNPWTFNFLFYTSYQVGAFLLSIINLDSILTISVTYLNIFPVTLYAYPKEVWWPTVFGGYVLAIITFPVFYFAFYYLVKAERAAIKKVVVKVHDIQEHRKEKKNRK